MENILIIGGSKGLGNYLSKKMSANNKVYVIARSIGKLDNVNYLKCDISDRESLMTTINIVKKIVFSKIIYGASLWGESDKLIIEELVNFFNVGPKGLLEIFNLLINNNMCSANCSFVSIGSIASIGSTASNYPCYKISKQIQQVIITQLQTQHKHSDYKFSNITLGSMQEDTKHVNYNDVYLTIDYITKCSVGCLPEDILLTSKSDK